MRASNLKNSEVELVIPFLCEAALFLPPAFGVPPRLRGDYRGVEFSADLRRIGIKYKWRSLLQSAIAKSKLIQDKYI